MKHPQHILFSDEVSSDDEIDHLFSQLRLIEPPEALIESILNTVARLPRPQYLSPARWDDFDGLIVRHDACEPS
jgi:hypothetical protein